MGKTTMNGNAKWVGLILVIMMAVAGWIWNAAMICGRVESNDKEDARVHPITEQNHDDIIEIKRDVTYIRKSVDEIKAELKK
jgi:hypothetical protein